MEPLPAQIRAEYSSSMFDLFFIFLTNMLRYSKNTDSRIFHISSQMIDEAKIEILLVNDLRDGVQEEELNHTFDEKSILKVQEKAKWRK